MFANCSKGYLSLALPDVCLLQSPAGAPTPLTCLSKTKGTSALPSSTASNVMVAKKPAHNTGTGKTKSDGNKHTAPLGGFKSHRFIGPTKHTKGSSSVFIKGKPATKLADPTKQNGSNSNAFGATMKPAQTKVMIMK